MSETLLKRMKNINVTLKDVALLSGVLVPTVLRVLNHEKFISEKVRKVVKETAARLKYKSSWYTKNLRSKNFVIKKLL